MFRDKHNYLGRISYLLPPIKLLENDAFFEILTHNVGLFNY